jgi:hypothetical protein
MLPSQNAPLRAKHPVSKKYEVAHCTKVYKTTAAVRFADGFEFTLPHASLWLMKKRKKTFKSPREKTSFTPRLGRYRRPPTVMPVRYQHGQIFGDFQRMLETASIREPGVCMFNDNHHQWVYAGLHPESQQMPGGGNACARPWECLKDAIGMPTGPYSSLTDEHLVHLKPNEPGKMLTVEEIIDEAINRVVRLFIDCPHKATLYFSVNPNDPPESVQIGLAIFAGAVGQDVRDYISEKIQSISRVVQRARQTGTRP